MQFWHKQGCPLFYVVHPAFPLPPTASPTLQSAMKDGFGEVVEARVLIFSKRMFVKDSRDQKENLQDFLQINFMSLLETTFRESRLAGSVCKLLPVVTAGLMPTATSLMLLQGRREHALLMPNIKEVMDGNRLSH